MPVAIPLQSGWEKIREKKAVIQEKEDGAETSEAIKEIMKKLSQETPRGTRN